MVGKPLDWTNESACRIWLSSAGVQLEPGSDRLSALSDNPNSSCRFSPIHSASFVGRQHKVCSMKSCKNQRTYTTQTKYMLVYTGMFFAYLCIYSYILYYTDIYYFNKVYTCTYSYVLCISVYILLYPVIYWHKLFQQSVYLLKYILVYTRMFSVYLCIYDWIPHPGTFTGTFTGIFPGTFPGAS